jgi:hypothetical protein
MPTFKILVFRDVSLVGKSEVFTPANKPNNNAVETTNVAVATFQN